MKLVLLCKKIPEGIPECETFATDRVSIKRLIENKAVSLSFDSKSSYLFSSSVAIYGLIDLIYVKEPFIFGFHTSHISNQNHHHPGSHRGNINPNPVCYIRSLFSKKVLLQNHLLPNIGIEQRLSSPEIPRKNFHYINAFDLSVDRNYQEKKFYADITGENEDGRPVQLTAETPLSKVFNGTTVFPR